MASNVSTMLADGRPFYTDRVVEQQLRELKIVVAHLQENMIPIGARLRWQQGSTLFNHHTYRVCDGSYLSISEYPDLFAVIGHSYEIEGTIEGQFKLPIEMSCIIRYQ